MLVQAVRDGWMKLRLEAGRIAVETAPLGNMTRTSSSSDATEQMSLRSDGFEASLSYQRESGGEKFTLEMDGRGRVRIARETKGDSPTASVEFVQEPYKPLVFLVETGESKQVRRGRSLWELMIRDRAACREHLLPLLRLLEPDWQLDERAEAVEAELLRRAAGPPPDRQRWVRLLDQLGAEKFSEREAAQRQFAEADTAALGFLQSLDFARLDAERQVRARRASEALALRLSGDRPHQVAAWLSGDPEIWLVLLARPEPAARQAAARHLEAMLGEPTGIDPAADPATQAARRRQLAERLRQWAEDCVAGLR
jgi:hypothetical protein